MTYMTSLFPVGFQEALNGAARSYLQDVESAICSETGAYPQFMEVISDWWDDKLDVFSLTVKIFTIFAEKSALGLLDGLNNILGLRGSLPRLHCSFNNDQSEDDFIAIIHPNGSRICPPPQLPSPSLTWIFSTESLTDDEPVSGLDQQKARWAIQLLHIELRYSGVTARKTRMKVLRKLVQNFEVLPPSLFIRNVTLERQSPESGGGYADIFKGQLKLNKSDTKPVTVCLKVLRVFQMYGTKELDKLWKEFRHEAFLWTQLDHSNILPCLGVSEEVFEKRPCLISPWMSKGNVMQFLLEDPKYDRLAGIIGIARGLSYLHGLEPQIVHGDVKGANILVDENGCWRLADFGLSLMVETHSIGATSTSSISNKGTTRWLAPELMSGDEKFRNPNKTARDIYAFACTMLEIFTGRLPFADQKIEIAVAYEVLQGKRPLRPDEMCMPWLDNVWKMMEECWAENSHHRPYANELVQRLERDWSTKAKSLEFPFSSNGQRVASGLRNSKTRIRYDQQTGDTLTGDRAFVTSMFSSYDRRVIEEVVDNQYTKYDDGTIHHLNLDGSYYYKNPNGSEFYCKGRYKHRKFPDGHIEEWEE